MHQCNKTFCSPEGYGTKDLQNWSLADGIGLWLGYKFQSACIDKNVIDFLPTTPLHSIGQSYKQFTLVNYDSRVVVTSKLLIFTTLDS